MISFVSFSAKFEDFIKPILQDIEWLEKGLIMKTIYDDAWVIGGLNCITSDLPQGNNLVEIKYHGAIHSCRTCNISID